MSTHMDLLTIMYIIEQIKQVDKDFTIMEPLEYFYLIIDSIVTPIFVRE